MRIRLVCLGLLLAACQSAAPIGRMRFANRAPVWRVDDRKDVPNKPANRRYARTLYHVDGYVVRRLTRLMELDPTRRAANVNALDEVPDSSWFTNRIGRRDLSVAEIHRGPNADDGPEQHKPWVITGSKVGGMSVGFLIKDARGRKYLLKFDDRRYPEVETAADVIAQRILWAIGYNVPEDTIVQFRRDELVVAEDAVNRDTMGNKSPMTVADLEDGLAKVYRDDRGVYRGLVSRYLPGVPIAGYSREGTRGDDPNDLIPHQRRRELRGQVAIFGWLNHTDLQEDNTLDVWEEDPERPGVHFVRHYLIDFGKSLGVMGHTNHDPAVGYSHKVDLEQALYSLVSFGLWRRPWEGLSSPGLRGVGLYAAERYDPGEWRSSSPYWPFKDADRFDAFWGAKLLIRFTPAQLRAAVEEGKYSDPRATEYMVETLVARQRRTARYWFEQVAPLDQFELRSRGDQISLCFDDLALRYRLADGAGPTRYQLIAYDYDGAPTGWRGAVAPRADGRACVDELRLAADRDGYTILRIVTRRGDRALPETHLHLARDPEGGSPRIIGLRRQ